MSPLAVDGVLRPDLDFRDVPAGTMAKYLGISRETLHQRTLSGLYPASAIRKHRSLYLYRPRLLVAA